MPATIGAPFGDPAQCCGEVLEIGDAVFQEVADPGGGLGEEARRDPDLDVLREDQDPDLRVAPSDLLGKVLSYLQTPRQPDS